ncbi:MAG: hypothetical protein PF637_02225 [Spirochaetes bacterium]|jgi:predicted Na+-dependent transporter|nr:hypothetical protein [Spirochaetota bacterium]
MADLLLNSRFTIFIVLGAALLLPSFPFLETALPFILGAVMFVNFITVDIKKENLADRPGIAYLILVLGVYPFAISQLPLGLPDAFYNGLILAIISPVALSSPVIASLTGANSSRLISHILFLHLLAPLSYGFHLFFTLKCENFTIPYIMIGIKVFTMIIVPFLLSRIFCTLFKNRSINHAESIKKGLFFLLVFSAVSSASDRVSAYPIETVARLFIIVFLSAVILYLSGYLCGRKTGGEGGGGEKITGALMFGHKNTGLSLWLTVAYLPKESAVPLILYIISHHLINGLLYSLAIKKTTKKTARRRIFL